MVAVVAGCSTQAIAGPLKTLVDLRWVHVALDDVQDRDVDLAKGYSRDIKTSHLCESAGLTNEITVKSFKLPTRAR